MAEPANLDQAIRAAETVLLQLLRDLEYTTQPKAWGHEATVELDRLATFEVAIRDAFKPWTWNGIDAAGKSYKDVVDQVGEAITALDQSAEGGEG
jgi:hypothetical protein